MSSNRVGGAYREPSDISESTSRLQWLSGSAWRKLKWELYGRQERSTLVKINCKARTLPKIRNKIRKRHKINYKYKNCKYPNLLRIRIRELKSRKLSHSQRAFSRFLRNIPHKLSIYGSCDFKAKFYLVESGEK